MRDVSEESEQVELAQRYVEKLAKAGQDDTPALRDCIASLAMSRGYIEVWHVAFADNPDMLARFTAEPEPTAVKQMRALRARRGVK